MNEIQNLVEQIKQATNIQINKQLLHEKMLTDLHVPYYGGLFKVTPELISFLSVMRVDVTYLEDTYNNPIRVNRLDLLDLCTQHYQTVMNTWHNQFEELKRARKI